MIPIRYSLRFVIVLVALIGAMAAWYRWRLVEVPQATIVVLDSQGCDVYLNDINLGQPPIKLSRQQLNQYQLNTTKEWLRRTDTKYGLWLLDCPSKDGTVPMFTLRTRDCSGDFMKDLRENKIRRRNVGIVLQDTMTLQQYGPLLPERESERIRVHVDDHGTSVSVTIDKMPELPFADTVAVSLGMSLVRIKDGKWLGWMNIQAANYRALEGQVMTLDDLQPGTSVFSFSIRPVDNRYALERSINPIGCFPRGDFSQNNTRENADP